MQQAGIVNLFVIVYFLNEALLINHYSIQSVFLLLKGHFRDYYLFSALYINMDLWYITKYY